MDISEYEGTAQRLGKVEIKTVVELGIDPSIVEKLKTELTSVNN